MTFFILPSLSELYRLSTGITVEAMDLDFQYLKQRISNLTKKESMVITNEVYAAQRVEYSNKKLYWAH